MADNPTQTVSPQSDQRRKLRKKISFLVKLLLSATALFFVFRKIDAQEALNTLLQINIYYFLLAFLAFNLSKIAAAWRFKAYLNALSIRISDRYNIELLYLGMFYNLFLPGSISGDGYKIYLLKQRFSVKTKHLVSATLLDRLSGLVLLLIMAGFFLVFSSFSSQIPYFNTGVIGATLLVLPGYYLFNRFLFPLFVPAFWSTTHWSFWVQTGQVLTALFLMFSLSVEAHYLDYLTLFMVSSVVAVLPFTIGGVGARELVFLYGFQYLDIQQETAITFTLLFFLTTALASLIGLFVSIRKDD